MLLKSLVLVFSFRFSMPFSFMFLLYVFWLTSLFWLSFPASVYIYSRLHNILHRFLTWCLILSLSRCCIINIDWP